METGTSGRWVVVICLSGLSRSVRDGSVLMKVHHGTDRTGNYLGAVLANLGAFRVWEESGFILPRLVPNYSVHRLLAILFKQIQIMM